MGDHAIADTIRTAMEAMNQGDMQAQVELLSDDVVWHEIGNPEPIRGKQALGERMSGSASDYTITGSLHDVVANGEHAIALVDATATRNGKTLSYRTAEIYHVKDGKITERWAFSDDTQAIADFFA